MDDLLGHNKEIENEEKRAEIIATEFSNTDLLFKDMESMTADDLMDMSY